MITDLVRRARTVRRFQGHILDELNIKELAFAVKKALLLGRLTEFGELLDLAWRYKRRLAEEISNPSGVNSRSVFLFF